MLSNIQKQIELFNLLPAGEPIVVGVSGGVDSTALLHLLWSMNQRYDYGWQIHVVHLNHSFRGEESREDARYVEALSQSLGVTCHLFERDLPFYMKQTGLGGQEASRKVRYELYQQVAEQVGAGKVAVAHHADDQVETILLRLLRGTGIGGLAGMPLRRWLVPGKIEVVRPLLSVMRQDLEEYCRLHGLQPRQDSSNFSRKYSRNKLRLDVLPLLADLNPRYRQHILQLAETARLEDAYLQRVSEQMLQEVCRQQKKGQWIVDRKKLQTCDLALQRRMITLILSYLSSLTEWSAQHVEAVLNVIESNRPSALVQLPNRVVVRRVYEYIYFEIGQQKNTVHTPFCYELTIPGETRIAECGVAIHASLQDSAPDWRKLSPTEAVFDADCLPDKLYVRSRQPGDRMELFGLQGTKKVKNLLIDAKVPQAIRDSWPLVVANQRILWVPGIRRSLHAPVTAKTKRFLSLQLEYREDWQEVVRHE